MIPVLSLADPAAGAAFLVAHLGFTAIPDDPLLLARGNQRVRLAPVGQPPQGMIALPFDHLAMRVPDADAAAAEGIARGAEYHPGFTPDGPHEIGAFGPSGVRYIFFRGPEGWPFEFVAELGAGGARDGATGHAHFGLRCASVPAAVGHLIGMGATSFAKHRLGEGDAAVNVEFLRLGEEVFEVFDAAPGPESNAPGGWIGFVA